MRPSALLAVLLAVSISRGAFAADSAVAAGKTGGHGAAQAVQVVPLTLNDSILGSLSVPPVAPLLAAPVPVPWSVVAVPAVKLDAAPAAEPSAPPAPAFFPSEHGLSPDSKAGAIASQAGGAVEETVSGRGSGALDALYDNSAVRRGVAVKASPLKKGQVVLDANIEIALKESANGTPLSSGEDGFIKAVRGLGVEFRSTEKTASEATVRPAVLHTIGEPISISVDRDGVEYRGLLRKLSGEEAVDGHRAVVGGKKRGQGDRMVVADVFFAETEPGVVPTFLTADGVVYKSLALLGGRNPETGERINPARLGNQLGVAKNFPKGFPVTIDGRTIWVIPIAP